MSIKTEIYTFKDLPKKRKYLITRLKEIYPSTQQKEIEDLLDKIKIRFREQEERGASNYKKKTVYLPLHDFKKFFLKSRDDVLRYMTDPKSTVTHETIHIFQNTSESFPDVDYLKTKTDGKFEINYDKYWNDPGEKQARLEQVLELLGWGLTKSEIIQLLYNRSHDDRELWGRIIDHAIILRKNRR